MWLAANPARRRHEMLWLAYTPVWIAVVGAVVLSRAWTRWGDAGHLALGIGLGLPPWIGALALPAPSERALPLGERFGVKAALFVTITALVQNYFGAAMFFDGLGMRYRFPVTLLVNRTPLFLYFITIAYFATYYAALCVAWRAVRACTRSRAARLLALAVLCYATAFAETYFMASDRLADAFSYADRARALGVGSACYGTLFLVTLPLLGRLDEEPGAPPAPLGRVWWEALGANLLALCAFEVYRALLRA
jgi:cycloeucalenol cycloisomerase